MELLGDTYLDILIKFDLKKLIFVKLNHFLTLIIDKYCELETMNELLFVAGTNPIAIYRTSRVNRDIQ